MTSKHTPGPWTVMEFPDEKFVEIRAHQGYAIVGHVFLNNGARDATARLIAAAPELLEALEGIANHYDMDGYGEKAWKDLALEMADLARAAIAEATGEAACAT